jgi:hypothetical protein
MPRGITDVGAGEVEVGIETYCITDSVQYLGSSRRYWMTARMPNFRTHVFVPSVLGMWPKEQPNKEVHRINLFTSLSSPLVYFFAVSF